MIDFARRCGDSRKRQARRRAHARELQVDGHKLVDFSIGEFDFPVPDNVQQAILRALERDDTRDTNVPVLRPCSMQSAASFAARAGSNTGARR